MNHALVDSIFRASSEALHHLKTHRADNRVASVRFLDGTSVFAEPSAQ